MKRAFLLLLAVMLTCTFVAAQSAGNQGTPLEKILSQMDEAAAKFKTAEANFSWDQYTKVVDEHDYQTGTIYFRRLPKEVQMAVDAKEHNGKPDKKYILYTDNTVQVFQPNIDQITKYNVGKNKSEAESLLALGFGARSRDLTRSYEIKYLGSEKVDNIETVKLELAPKAESVRRNFNRIVLWMDAQRGVSIQQQFWNDTSGDYRLTKYTNIRLNERLSDDIFKLKKSASTKIVTP